MKELLQAAGMVAIVATITAFIGSIWAGDLRWAWTGGICLFASALLIWASSYPGWDD